MSRYAVLHRYLHWDGKSGSFAFGNTRRAFPEPPDVGIPEMVAIDYSPHEGRYEIVIAGALAARALTAPELIGIEDRMYMADRGAGDPFRRGWKRGR